MKATSALLLLIVVFAASASAATHTVDIASFMFTPDTLTIQQGDTVTWIWINGGHSTTSTTPGETWDSGVRNTTPSQFSRTFITAGTFPYFCSPHFSFMTGTIIVEAAINNPPPVPAFINATATSAATVALSWGASTGATGYDVFRSSNGSPFAPLLSTAATMAADDGLQAATTYLYRVRATSTGGASAFTSSDAATTIVFTDANLAGEIIKAVHFSELRIAVNAMRAAASLGDFAFTDVSLAGIKLQAVHVAQLRSALNAARSAIGMPAITFVDPVLTPESTLIRAVHATELRAGTQ